ncbi:hypothetical protein [Xanthobacter autotrophicus]|uniref:hypothetical protein n=1 Tax=Xanthobacter autotrophicus TaxID=280 RepID=UPI0024A65915|nr:hypothetical protein [Xanthobacter autotrophicus]MDI4655059.1 hypothetical protein [Xanthobacter autotrophicus]
MDDQISSRRALLRLATLAAGGAMVAASAQGAQAYQGNMERAIGELETALRSLREATPDKGGHRERVIALIQEAMGEVQAGIDYAAR